MLVLNPLLVSLFLLLSTIQSYAEVFNIPSGNVTALVAAINAANANGEENTINLEPGTYTLTAIDNGVIDSNSNGLPIITGIISINGIDALATFIERDPAAPIFRIFSISSSGKLSVDGLTVRRGGGSRTQLAGGFSNAGTLTITRSIVEQIECCDLSEASAIRNTGTLKLSETHVTDNHSLHGVTIRNLGTMTIVSSSITFNGDDAAIIENFSSADTRIEDSTVSNNFPHGGPIFNAGTMMITNSSIGNNKGLLGGHAVSNMGTLSIVNTTIAGNHSGHSFERVGGVRNTGGSAKLQNSIIGHNSGQDCVGSIVSLGNNIIGDPTSCDITLLSSDLTGDPGLGNFTDNGAPGNGHFPLLETSPAIDTGNNDVCLSGSVLNKDQIGNPRIGICDIGAIEFQPAVTVLPVALNIRPGNANNNINPNSNGVIPVAVLSTNTFDATTVDQTSVRFGPNQAVPERTGHF